MSKYTFDLKNREILDTIRSPYIYQFNLARNLALLSNDPAVIRYFFQIEAAKLTKDQWLIMQIKDRFLAQYREGQAFSYFGIIPMIVQAKVNLLTSAGFKCKSKYREIDEALNKAIDEARLQEKFSGGAYWESGIGDFAYRLAYDPTVSDKPIIDIIEPHHLEVNWSRGKVVSYVIKETAEENFNYELCEIHSLNQDGFLTITYRFRAEGKWVDPTDKFKLQECQQYFPDVDISERVFPFRDIVTIVYKQNANSNKLYRGERGVPDIQGLDTIEDSLTESISDLMDAIRKGGVKEYVDESLIPQDASGNDLKLDKFNKTIITTKGSSNPAMNKNLWQVTMADIKYDAYIQTIQTLISVAVNKAALSPTTLGITGLESINSSAESQEARERTSLRTRELALRTWELTLTTLLNRYLQIMDYIKDRDVLDYHDIIKISFDDYIIPSSESVTDVLVRQVGAGLKSREHAIMDLNTEYEQEDAEKELLDIMSENGQPVLQSSGEVTDENMGNIDPSNDKSGNSDPNMANMGNSTQQMLNNL